MMIWSRTALKSELIFRTTLLLGVPASNASDPLIIGYLLELVQEDTLVGPTMLMRQASTTEF
jgi:hypothetical protein